MHVDLVAAHWLYLAGVIVVLVTMGLRRNPIIPAVLFTGLVAWVFTGDLVNGIVAVFNGPHPETGEDLEVVDRPPEGALPQDLPSQPAVFAPDYAPEEISEIAQKLRKAAGLPDEPIGEVANPGNGGVVGKVKDKLS